VKFPCATSTNSEAKYTSGNTMAAAPASVARSESPMADCLTGWPGPDEDCRGRERRNQHDLQPTCSHDRCLRVTAGRVSMLGTAPLARRAGRGTVGTRNRRRHGLPPIPGGPTADPLPSCGTCAMNQGGICDRSPGGLRTTTPATCGWLRGPSRRDRWVAAQGCRLQSASWCHRGRA
jgi:hypothetical protein